MRRLLYSRAWRPAPVWRTYPEFFRGMHRVLYQLGRERRRAYQGMIIPGLNRSVAGYSEPASCRASSSGATSRESPCANL